MATDTPRIARLREMEVWIARVRLVAVLFGVVEVAFLTEGYPPRYEDYAWITTGVFALGAIVLFVASKRADPRTVGIIALAFDTCVIAAYATIYSFEYGSSTRWALIFVVVEAALRYGLFGPCCCPSFSSRISCSPSGGVSTTSAGIRASSGIGSPSPSASS